MCKAFLKFVLTSYLILYIIKYKFSFWRHALNEKVGSWIQNDKRVRDGGSLIESVCEQGTREHEWTRKSGLEQTIYCCLTQAK
ncbi:hypothetical protein DN757_19610 [Paenibacillus silvae]|uniref:Uncharacterized protein n=1 Tax=Paenibacillus silvae TaxID=1325358 RepID=A0A2W6P2F1_9BACL|nr:hypothetical protein DN757_19610 [Paenibacillus silvae]